MNLIKHRSIQASAAAGVALAAAEVATDLPWWLWATWAALSAVAIVQATRAEA